MDNLSRIEKLLVGACLHLLKSGEGVIVREEHGAPFLLWKTGHSHPPLQLDIREDLHGLKSGQRVWVNGQTLTNDEETP